jgi:hypothetical protein
VNATSDRPWSHAEKRDLAEKLAMEGRPVEYIIEQTGLIPLTVKCIVSRVRFEFNGDGLRKNRKDD